MMDKLNMNMTSRSNLPMGQSLQTENVREAKTPSAKELKKDKTADQDTNAFAAELAAAALQTGKAPEARVPAQLVPGQSTEGALKDASKGEGKAAGVDATKAALADRVQSEANSIVDRLPVALKPEANSKNTVAAIAGPKPWSKDWVFTGMEEANPEMKTLFGSEASKAAQALPKLEGARSTGGEAAVLAAIDEKALARLIQEAQSGGAVQSQAAPAVNPLNAGQQQLQQQAVAAPGLAAGEHSALAGQLRELNGSLEGTTVTSGKPNAVPQKLQGNAKGGAQSALSGAEFLSTLSALRNPGARSGMQQQSGDGQGDQGGKPTLKVIDGGLKKPKGAHADGEEALLMKSVPAGAAGVLGTGAAGSDSQVYGARPRTEVSAPVTTGANATDRLSSEGLAGVSVGIRNLSNQGGGEMRIRLKPENLGELHVRVVTSGNDVGLHFQASDEKAKKILEDSIGHLKESLASQSLNLGNVEVAVAQAGGSQAGEFRNDQQPQSQHQHHGFDLMNQNANQGNQQGRTDRWINDNDGQSSRPVASAMSASAANARLASGGSRASVAGAGRLDVRA